MVPVILQSLDGLTAIVRVPRNQKIVIRRAISKHQCRVYLFGGWVRNPLTNHSMRKFVETLRHSQYVELAEVMQRSFSQE